MTTRINKLPELIKETTKLNGKVVEVGAFEGEHAWLVGIHEFGCRIQVTDKMRAFLHYKNIHLSAKTKYIVIPERSFIRAGYDKYIVEVNSNVNKLVGFLATGQLTTNQLLTETGLLMSSKIKTYARDLRRPQKAWYGANTPLAPRSSNPLIETGEMIRGITYRIK